MGSRSWGALSRVLKNKWLSMKCESNLEVKAPSKVPTRLNMCLLVANGRSLNRQTWNFTDDMDYMMGTDNIYLNLNKYSLSLNAYVVVDTFKAERFVHQIMNKVSPSTEIFASVNFKKKLPTGADIYF